MTAIAVTAAFGMVRHTQADPGHGHGAPAAEAVPAEGHGEPGGHPSGEHDGETGHGHHGTIEVPVEQPVPTVTLTVHPDPVRGWNLEVQTEHWVFAPEQVNQSSLTTEGHAHLYINGEQVTRLYSTWSYLPSLPSGEHLLTVGLNANGHEGLTHNSAPIEATVTVVVP
ncbi:MAG: hypothetical protein HC812_08440 [Leptolyngbya sp. RL_3_1]|nr:hypothetical protein [Leptolyngbya sp. RL_3_1]